MAQLVARDLRFSHGPVPVLEGVTLTVAPGHRVGILGPNGVGKSTLLRLLAGELRPAGGVVERVPPAASVGHLTQELHIAPGETVTDVIDRRTGAAAAQAELDAATAGLAAGSAGADERYATALERWLASGAVDIDQRRPEVLARVGLPAGVESRPAAWLSGGQRARVNLACVLLSGFDVLLLDEPTNDLDLEGLALLERFLLEAREGVVVVSHDRAFLERVVNAVVEIDEHERVATRFDGGWRAYLEATATARRHAEEAYAAFTDKRDTLAGRARREREWSTTGVRKAARNPRDGDKFVRHFNMQKSEQLAARAKRTERAIERLDVVDKPWDPWDLRLTFADAGRGGDRVVEWRHLVVERGAFRLGPLSGDVTAGDRVALVGPNGSGKSTLLAATLGRVAPTEGAVRLGPSVVVGELDQARRRFGGGTSLLDTFVGETGLDATASRSQLAKLGLGAEHVSRPSERLSPGERTRAVLAAFALSGVNLLVLDEPTNHLDMPAIEALEVALEQFPGTVLLVTHDRALLAQVRLTRRITLADGQVVSDEAV